MEKPLEVAQLGWGGVSRNHQGMVNVVRWFKGELRFGAYLLRLPVLLSLERAALISAPPALTLKLVNSVPPHYVLDTFSAAASVLQPKVKEFVSKRVPAQAPKKKSWDSSSPPSHSDTIPKEFYSQILWDSSFLALGPSWGARYGAGTSSSGETATAKIALLILNCGCGTCPFHVSTLPTGLVLTFFIPLVIGLLFS